MNYLEISSFIEAKKKRKAHIEEELRYVNTLTYNLRAEKPIKWYNNFYYIVKRAVFIILAILSLLLLSSTFTHQNSFKKKFSQHFEGIISAGLNDTFGTHRSVTVLETSAVDSHKAEAIISKPVRADIQMNISSKVYDYSLMTVRIIFLLAVLLFWYIARLTRKLHFKNRLISDYYDSNLTIMNIYKEVIQEQNFEIDFLTKASSKKNN
ncbi:hypothetical protein OF897_12170 [Chryseobacterium formosus]|uniref:Uncharacterized protein n=1 Tax=Chryseobacterium formosus TaxID=1537363 RepID=A0ABT3XRC7_9FLAO|nr:hypothetical protein [Chryseobacterium formosus]MCX8524669.1 hypothetical protein [Chryseobacterium formosus]